MRSSRVEPESMVNGLGRSKCVNTWAWVMKHPLATSAHTPTAGSRILGLSIRKLLTEPAGT